MRPVSARIGGVDWGVIGHRWAVELLARQLARGTNHHAYLITGPDGVGRQRLALALARAVLCERPPRPGESCGECRACEQVGRRVYPDLHVVERADDRQGITIEQIRDLQRQLSLAPLAGRARVGILLEMEKASEGAANALLKTLEEPAGRVVLILTASEAEAVPPTIASRCEILALRPVADEEIERHLMARGADAAAAQQAARLAGGRPEHALRFLEEPALLARREAYRVELADVLGMDLAGRFVQADAWKDDDDLEERLQAWMEAGRAALHGSLAEGGAARGAAMRGVLDADAARRLLLAIVRTLEGLRQNANVRLALETLMLDLPQVRSGPPEARRATG